MSTLLKVMCVLTAGVVLYAGLDSAGAIPDSLSLSTDQGVPVNVEFHPISVTPDDSEPAREVSVAKLAPAVIDVTRTPLENTSVSKPASEETHVRATVVDERGVPLAGVQVYSLGLRVETRSNDQGLVELDLTPAQAESKFATLVFSKLDRATTTRNVEFDEPREIDLGIVRLEQGGLIMGRITDQQGKGIADAQVTWTKGSTPARRLVALRFGNQPASFPSCTTEPDGSFELPGVPVGIHRLWASAKDYESQFTAPLEVRAGFESRGIEIQLPPLRPENHVLVRVLNPASEPVPGAILEYRYSSAKSGMVQSGTRHADEQGRHEFVVVEDTRLWIHASDEDAEFGTASRDSLSTGPDEVILQLSEAAYGTLVVSRVGGREVGEFEVELRSSDGELLHERIFSDPDTPGSVRFRMPDAEFRMLVFAPLAKVSELGPIKQRDAKSLAVTLVDLPGMKGTIRALGSELAGAKVTLHKKVSDEIEYSVNGFRCSYERDALDEVVTNDRGHFILTIREPGEYVVRAEAEGFAPGDTTPFSIAENLRGFSVDLELGRGGTLEGEVRAAAGESPHETVVGISRGDGFARTTRVGDDGKFRFERLTPGGWRVREREEEIRSGNTSTSTRGGGPVEAYESLSFDCDVLEGLTTFHAVELAGAAGWSFRGQLSVAGSTRLAWSAELVPPNKYFVEQTGRAIALDARGRFELPVRELGAYQLVLRADWADSLEYFIVHPVDIETDSPWAIDLDIGELRVQGAPEWDGKNAPPLALYHELENGGFILLAFGASERVDLTLRHAPAGRSKLLKPSFENLDPKTWEVIREVEVPSGGSVLLEL